MERIKMERRLINTYKEAQEELAKDKIENVVFSNIDFVKMEIKNKILKNVHFYHCSFQKVRISDCSNIRSLIITNSRVENEIVLKGCHATSLYLSENEVRKISFVDSTIFSSQIKDGNERLFFENTNVSFSTIEDYSTQDFHRCGGEWRENLIKGTYSLAGFSLEELTKNDFPVDDYFSCEILDSFYRILGDLPLSRSECSKLKCLRDIIEHFRD